MKVVTKNLNLETLSEFKQELHEVFYYENNTHFFLGPYRHDEKEACFGCFVSILKQNSSKYYDILMEQPVCKTYQQLLKKELGNIILEPNSVLIFDKQTQNCVVKRIRKDIYCENCKNHIMNIDKSWNIQKDAYFNKDGRVYSFKKLMNKINTHYDELIDMDLGIGKNIFRDVESDVIPMYGVQSFLGEREYYSYGRTKSLAESKYIGCLEMIERYSSMIPQFRESIYGRYKDLKKEYSIIDPQNLHLIEESNLDKDYYIKKYDFNKKFYWTKCLNLKNNKEILLPEQTVYYDNQLLRKEERYLYETSNGTALGGSLEEAIIYSLFELIERDSFLVYWYTKRIPKIIDIEEYDDEMRLLIEIMREKGYILYLLDITLETHIPTIWVMAVNQRKLANLKIYNAAGCHIDAKKAAKSALVEVVSSMLIYDKVLYKNKINLAHLINNPKGVVSMEDHVNYYSFEENTKNFDYILNQIDQLEVTTISEMNDQIYLAFEYDQIISHIRKYHPDIYVANLENYITNMLDLAVVKTIIPSMQPMTFGMRNERLNRNRIKKYLPKGGEFNREPHPFP